MIFSMQAPGGYETVQCSMTYDMMIFCSLSIDSLCISCSDSLLVLGSAVTELVDSVNAALLFLP